MRLTHVVIDHIIEEIKNTLHYNSQYFYNTIFIQALICFDN